MDFTISCNQADLDSAMIHQFLSQESAWATGIPLETVKRAMANSLCFGGFLDGKQIAFARVISDYATFANLVDVFVLAEFRGQGFSKLLLQAVFEHADLQNLRRFTLATSNAHGLYAQFGFTSLKRPDTFMERYNSTVYLSS